MGRYERYHYDIQKDEESNHFKIRRSWKGTVNEEVDFCCNNLKLDVLNVMRRLRGGEWELLDPYYKVSYLSLSYRVPMLEIVCKMIFEHRIQEFHMNNPYFTIDFTYDYLKGEGRLRIIQIKVEKEEVK